MVTTKCVQKSMNHSLAFVLVLLAAPLSSRAKSTFTVATLFSDHMVRRLLHLSGILLISSLQAAEQFWDEIPLSASSMLPAKVQDDYWNGQFQRVNREVAAAKDARLVFFGDSITWSWSLGPATGRDVWAQHFAEYNPINMGNSGDITPVMLHRVTRGNLDFPAGQHPKVAVILCGINNLIVSKSDGGKETWDLGAHCPPEDIAQGQRAIAQVFRRKLPQTHVIMMALLPVADKTKWAKCQRVNAINASVILDPKQVTFINLQDRFLLPDGSINRSLFTDGIHLNKEGYQVWANGIKPIVDSIMKAPPLEPVKIMLIGGSTTEGISSSNCYRSYLDGMLRTKGHLIDFVGSRKRHNNATTEPDSYQFDPDHEGHWGKDSAWFVENMGVLLERNVPDVAVIQLGAEDIAASQTAAESLTDGVYQNIERVIKTLRTRNDKVKIVITGALPITGKEEATHLLNHKLSLLVQSTASSLQPVVLVKLGQVLDPGNIDQTDSLPNAATSSEMAVALANALHPLLASRQK
jgi:lysophospholipase L1-like esterase